MPATRYHFQWPDGASATAVVVPQANGRCKITGIESARSRFSNLRHYQNWETIDAELRFLALAGNAKLTVDEVGE